MSRKLLYISTLHITTTRTPLSSAPLHHQPKVSAFSFPLTISPLLPPLRKKKNRESSCSKEDNFLLGKKGNPRSDALLLAFEDPAPAPITSPFSEDSPRALALHHELSADLPGFLSAPHAKDVSSLPLEPFSPFFPENDDDEVLLPTLDVLMTEPAPKRTLRSSRSTDAKSSETPVVDDVLPSSNSSPGKKQRGALRKKRDARGERARSLSSLSFALSVVTIRKNRKKFLEHRSRKITTSVFVMKQFTHNTPEGRKKKIEPREMHS